MKSDDKTREQLAKEINFLKGKNSREQGQDSVRSVPADKRSQHLIRSIVIVAVVAVLVVVGFAGFALYTEYRANIEVTKQRAENKVAVFHEHIKLAIGGLDAVMQAIADKIRVDDFSGESFRASLIRMKAELPILRVLLAVDEHGLIINESRDPYEARGTNIADRLYFRKHLEPDTRGVYIGPPVVSRIDGKWAMPISRAVRDEDGLFRGVVVASIKPYYFSELFTAMAFSPDYTGFLTHADGTVLALFPYDETRIGTSVTNSELFRRHLPTAYQGVFQERDPSDGITRIVAYRLIDPWPLIVSFSISKKDGLAPFYRFVIIWAIVVAFILSVIIYVAHYQIGQTLKLAEQATTLQRSTDDLRMEITEREQAEEAVRDSEERLRSITENSSDHIMLVGQDLKIQFINKTVPDLKKEDVIGKSINDFTPKGFQKLAYDKFQSVFKTGKPTNYQTEYITAEGGTYYFDVRLSPITKDGKVVSVVSSSNNIKVRKQAEDELKKHREHLEELVKERTRELGEKNVELERFNKLFIDREFRIKKLKEKLRKYEL